MAQGDQWTAWSDEHVWGRHADENTTLVVTQDAPDGPARWEANDQHGTLNRGSTTTPELACAAADAYAANR